VRRRLLTELIDPIDDIIQHIQTTKPYTQPRIRFDGTATDKAQKLIDLCYQVI